MHKLITLTFTGKSIKFGNYTCLPKTTVEKMVNEKIDSGLHKKLISQNENIIIQV